MAFDSGEKTNFAMPNDRTEVIRAMKFLVEDIDRVSKFYQKVLGLADFFPLFGHARESDLLNRRCFIFRLT